MVVIVQGGQEVTLPLFADHVYMPGAQYTAQSTRHVHKYSHLKSGMDTVTSQPPCNLVSLNQNEVHYIIGIAENEGSDV